MSFLRQHAFVIHNAKQMNIKEKIKEIAMKQIVRSKLFDNCFIKILGLNFFN